MPTLKCANPCTLETAIPCQCVPQNQLYSTDTLQFLDQIPDHSIDLIIADPPYNVSHKDEFHLKGRSPIKRDFGAWDHYTKDAYWKFTDEWVGKAIQKLKEGGSFYSFFDLNNISFLRTIAERHGLYSKGTLVWRKTNPAPQIRKRGYVSAIEGIFYGVKVPNQRPKDSKPFTFNFLGQNEMHNIIESSIVMGKERLKHPTEKNERGRYVTLHPTQKPERVVERLIRVSSNEGDLVLDPFMGTGTVPAVAKRLCRHYLGTDHSQLYADAAQARVNAIAPVCDGRYAHAQKK